MALTYETFDINNVIFEDVKKIQHGKLEFQRIIIKYLYDNGKTDKLSIKTPELFSWGIQEKHPYAVGSTASAGSDSDSIVEGYTMSFVMFDQNSGPTEEQAGCLQMFEEILSKCKSHLKSEEVKAATAKYQMDALTDLMDIFYRKKDKGIPIAGLPPTMYPKLYTKFDANRLPTDKPEITTGFYDANDDPIDPTKFIGSRCKAIGDIIVDNIYIGAKPSIQIKLNDVIVLEQFAKVRKLMAPAKSAFVAKPISVFEDSSDVKPTEEKVVRNITRIP